MLHVNDVQFLSVCPSVRYTAALVEMAMIGLKEKSTLLDDRQHRGNSQKMKFIHKKSRHGIRSADGTAVSVMRFGRIISGSAWHGDKLFHANGWLGMGYSSGAARLTGEHYISVVVSSSHVASEH